MSHFLRNGLFFLFAAAMIPICYAQAAAEKYQRAYQQLAAHSDGFLNDNSPEAIAAIQQMWAVVTDFVIEQRLQQPPASPKALEHSLCLLTAEPEPPEAIQETPEEQCDAKQGDLRQVVEIDKGLILVAASVLEDGTVFLLDERSGKPTPVWSIANAGTQKMDEGDLLGSWKPERTRFLCWKESAKPGSCGPLYALVGNLPPDDKGRPRFYVDAGYQQDMGATILKQTSIWRWDGDHAELQWIGIYNFMIDQKIGTSLDADKGALLIGAKGYFRTMADCGSCIERPMEQRVLLTKTGVEDLGVRSLVPEMDVIDEFFWRLAHGTSTAGIASVQAANAIRSEILDSTKESRKIDPTFYSVGMVSSTTKTTKNGAEVCLVADDISPIKVLMIRKADGGYFVSQITKLKDSNSCPSPAF